MKTLTYQKKNENEKRLIDQDVKIINTQYRLDVILIMKEYTAPPSGEYVVPETSN